MSERIHFIIASDGNDPRSLVFSKRSLKVICAVIGVSLLLSFGCSFFTAQLFYKDKALSSQVAKLQKELSETNTSNEEYAQQVTQLQYKLKFQLTQFQAEKRELVNSAVSELKERSQFIEEVMGDIGVKIKKKSQDTGEENRGGPFITIPESERQSLIQQTDNYLKMMSKLPLGRPVPGIVTSSYGSRKDPKNKKAAFHSGIDFRGKRGSEVLATADGVVRKAGRNGSYGLFVQIDHGNGYSTCFAHLKKYLVRKGEKVSRGQSVGLVGSTGRSLGPHLHYEVRHDNKPVNPKKFLKVANLSFLSTSK